MENNNNSNVVQFELFKNQKALDKEYPIFLSICEKFFKSKATPEAMLKRLYYTMRYLEGHINGLGILLLLTNMSMEDQKAGIKHIISWLESLLLDLKDILAGYERYDRTK